MMTPASAPSTDDLIPDRALTSSDEDAFNHQAIIGQLARHVLDSNHSLNIALYGPWGSGKSSAFELLRRDLSGQNVELVKYDAWRYGGEALRRNFISHAATALGFPDNEANRPFHRGLYESQRTAGFKPPAAKQVLIPLGVFGLCLLGILVIVALVAGVSSYFTANSPAHEIGIALTKMTAPAAFVAILVAAAKAAIDGAGIQIEQSRPSEDEQFAQCFRTLVSQACKKHRAKRLIFYVDELDRCSPPEVVTTLTSIKTFLDQEGCIFIVAADRQVLEQALTTDLEQATPPDEDNPYYSSASSFLDKVFHHQFFLPPMRSMSLTRFARDLLSSQHGLWAELRDTEGQDALDRVIYALVPSHVVSPRRVKVLLNNFATNARIAEARGLPWRERAPEIAKLTVLQTEFPLLSADLHHEPRLPELLLRAPNAPSEQLKRLLERHGVSYENHTPDVAPMPTDPVITEDSEARNRIQAVQHRDLRRYLQRTESAGIMGPGRDLLYLQAAGNAHGLEDVTLSELIERDARETPASVVDAALGREDAEVSGITGVLADMADSEFGEERRNVVVALLGVTELLGDRVQPLASRVTDSLSGFLGEGSAVDGHQRPAAVRVALLAGSHGRPLLDSLLGQDGVFDDPDQTRELAMLLPGLPDHYHNDVYGGIAQHSDDTSLIAPLTRDLPVQQAEALWDAEPVREAIRQRAQRYVEGSEEGDGDEEARAEAVDQYIGEIYGAALDRSDGVESVVRRVQWTLLTSNLSYKVVLRHAATALDSLKPSMVRDSHALQGMTRGTSEDWAFWTSYLSHGSQSMPWRPRVIEQNVKAVIEESDHPDALTAAVRLAPFLSDVTDGESLGETTRAQLAQTQWWSDDDGTQHQQRLYEVILALTGGGGADSVRDALMMAMHDDLLRVVEPNPANPASRLIDSPYALVAVAQLGSLADPEAATEIVTHVRPLLESADQSLVEGAAQAEIALVSSARSHGAKLELSDEAQLIRSLQSGTRVAKTIAADWLDLDPTLSTIVAVARKVGNHPGQRVIDALDRWAERHSKDERTGLLVELSKSAPRLTSWARRIARLGIDDPAIIRAIDSHVSGAARAGDRGTQIDLLVAVAPSGTQAQRAVADLVLDLLATGKRVDFDLALDAAGALGTEHRSAERLRQALDDATKKHGYKVPPKSVEALARAGVKPKKRSLTEAAVDRFVSFIKG